jgi:hypothetical protein
MFHPGEEEGEEEVETLYGAMQEQRGQGNRTQDTRAKMRRSEEEEVVY